MDTGDVQLYVRLITGMVLGLSVGRLFTGAAKFVQHPERYRFDIIHMLWIFVLLMSVVTFWWYEALTFANVEWQFHTYLFQILYCCTFLFLCAMILPDDIDGFDSYYAYFIARRRWFFSILILNYTLSVIDTLIKESANYEVFAIENLAVDAVMTGVFILAMRSTSRRFHMIMVSTAVGLIGLMTLGSVFIDIF